MAILSPPFILRPHSLTLAALRCEVASAPLSSLFDMEMEGEGGTKSGGAAVKVALPPTAANICASEASPLRLSVADLARKRREDAFARGGDNDARRFHY